MAFLRGRRSFVDISKTFETKLEALSKHVSQGVQDAEEWVRERAREVGGQAGYELAEGSRRSTCGTRTWS